MNTSTDYKTLVSSSATHAAAIGHFGHVYVWGKNTAFRDFKGSRDADGKMTTITKEDVTCQLGFNDPSIKEIETPIAIRIKHPVYRIIAEQVACGPNFTCIVAKEKESFDLTNQDEDIIIDGDEVAERDTFEEEISEEEIMTRGDLDFLKSPAEIKGTHQEIVIIGRQIRHEISTYLRENQERIMDLFKSSKIREDSFMSIMRQQIQSIVSDAKLRAYIKVKKMRIPGLKLYLKPIYELLKKCRECKGTLYVFGKDISPTKSGNPQSITISENTMGYSLIELPLGVIISKVSCGEDFVVILSISGELLSFGNRKIDALGVKKQTNYNTIASFEPPLFDIIDIVCGQKHCMALRTGGVVFSWGDGQFGKLGHGNSDSTRKPEPIGLDTSAAFLIRAGDRNSICVTDKETIFCFGDSSEKQFGKIGIFEKPERCFMPFSIQDVCIGDKYVVYVSQEGELYVYGPPHLVDLTDNCLSRRYRHLEEVRFINVSGSSDIFFALSTNGSIFS